MTTRDDRRAWRLAVSAVVWAMYGVSLALPAIADVWPNGEPMMGYVAVQPMWPDLTLMVPWFANLALIAGWVGFMTRQQALAFVAGLAAVGLSASTIPILQQGIKPLLVGFWLWFGTMVVFALAAGYELLVELRGFRRSDGA